jgi:hypothetical protein
MKKTMLLKTTLSLMLGTALVFSCTKKDDATPEDPAATTTTTGGTTGTTGGTTGGAIVTSTVANTGTWTENGTTYFLSQATSGGGQIVSVAETGLPLGTEKRMVALDHYVDPHHELSFTFMNGNYTAGTYTIVPYSTTVPLTSTTAFATEEDYTYDGAGLHVVTYKALNSLSTVSIVNNGSTKTFSVSTVTMSMTANTTTTTPVATKAITGFFTK